MGMYNTASAFCGLGKPTINLEFDSNAALLDFQRKMQSAGADAAEAEWYDIPSSRETVPAVRGLEGVTEQKSKDIFFKLIESEPQFIDLKNEADNYVNNTTYLKEDSNGVLKRAYKFVSPIENIFCWSDFGHIVKDNSSRQNRTNILPLIKPTIEQPNLIINYEGENYYIKPFITENNEKILFSFIPTLVCNSNIKTLFTPKRNYLYNKFFDKNGKKKQTAVLRYQKDGILDASSIFNGTEPQDAPFKYVELRLFIIKTQNNEKGLNAPGDVYIITDTRTKPRKELEETAQFKKFDIRPFDSSEFAADGSVVWFPIKDLNFDRRNFQNREDDYSQDSVDKIVKAVKKGEFNWAVFDAVTIWQNPDDGKFYVLSGHSRSEAFKRLAAQGATAQGKDFKRIPAKIFKGTLQEARQLALNSNTLSTKETNFERANYWRDVYERELAKQGGNRKAAENVVIQQLKETEGKNANSVFYISFLNKKGIFYDALRMLANAPTQDRERLKVVAEWVGHLRKDRPKLTDAHETELFNFLITDGNYNKAVTNYADLLKRIDTAIIKNTDNGKFDPSKALNLKKNIVADTSERAYIEELARLKKIWDEAETTVKNKLAEWRNRQKYDNTITDMEILDKIERYKQYATLAKADYYAFLQKKNQYINADKNQPSLFGKTASDTLYNNPSILDSRGLIPTYRILQDYSAFFGTADNRSTFAGFGLDDTKELIADTCRKHYKECKKIANHLKDDNLKQSCFNLWHWLHHNIRYEYDREGREEIRTPLRTWHDRKTGVDCDCLSVFAWCVLTCMGYNPDFELVAFKGRPQFSHIFINCGGIVVDRVWFIFNSRPPGVTKREIYKVSLLSNLGKLF